ncbi:MAG: hypothetical protein KF729_03075 [Sandaracinaceae bacterium]|nr:hypothetical protein [Sandaracinaceae bacterium]
MRTRAWLAVVVAACGAPPAPRAGGPSGCAPAVAEARGAWTALAANLATEAAPSAPTPIDDALARLGAHVADLRQRAPETVEPEARMAVSGAVMDALDALGALDDATRARVDDAAEALLADPSPVGSVRAAREASSALRDALEASDRSAFDARRERASAERLRRAAQGAAAGYDEGVAVGDRRAARAEAVPVPREARPAHEAAAAASRRAREACGVSRALAVPSP